MKGALVAVLIALAAQNLGAQSAPAQSTPIPLTLPDKSENPFSRFEIVSLGAFPIMLFYTSFAFDLGSYVANGFDSTYAPWPFKSAKSAVLSDKDRITRLSVTLGASLIVGAVDAYMHAKKLEKAKRLREASETLSAPPPNQGSSPPPAPFELESGAQP